MEEDIDCAPMMLLPNEIVGLILQKVKCRDIVNFGATCKYYNEFVTTNQYIWKEKLREILPCGISKVVEKHGNGNWLDEMKRFYSVKQKVYEELLSMSPKYYWRTSELTMDDCRNFFDLGLSYNIHYHYVIVILQDIIRKGNRHKCADRYYNEKMGALAQRTQNMSLTNKKLQIVPPRRPFTMTDVYYAKIVVRFMTHNFLTVKWVQSHMRNELTPDAVVNFFVQWVDPVHMHSDDIVRESINTLVVKVESMFPNDISSAAKGCFDIREKIKKGLLSQKQVLEAVSDVIYRQYHLTIISGANLHSLDIVKSLHIKCSSLIVAAVIYQAVARNCGVHCELIAFPNHLFLEWRNPLQPANSFKIDLETGELAPQGRCPFAPTAFRKEYKYSPDGFLQYVVSAFLMTMGAIKNWYTQNALYLLDFLSNNVNDDNPYRDFLPYLDAILDCKQLPPTDIPVELEYIHDSHRQIINTLSNLNSASTNFTREIEVKQHDASVTFAVGMLAYHKKYDYLCVVRGWDLKCATDWRRRVEFKNLEFGSRQPFYSVIAVDQSERYVAQENLIHVDQPTRLFHLEDVIAKEFSHFDGYCYVPNPEKQKEYPGDAAVRQMYRSRAAQRADEMREAL